MYICQRCRRVSPPSVRSHRLVVETRLHRHPYRPQVFDDPHKKDKKRDDPGGLGPQIVREIRVCPGCYAMHA